MLSTDLSVARSRSDAEDQLKEKIGDQRIRQFLKNIFWKDDDTLAWRLNLPVLKASMNQVFEGIRSSNVFTGPTLFIRGGLSDYVTEEDTGLIRKNFPEARIRTIASAGHWIHADAPDEFLKVVLDFLNTG